MHVLVVFGWLSSLWGLGGAPLTGSDGGPRPGPGVRPTPVWQRCPRREAAPARPLLWEALRRGAGVRRLAPSPERAISEDEPDEDGDLVEEGASDGPGGEAGARPWGEPGARAWGEPDGEDGENGESDGAATRGTP